MSANTVKCWSWAGKHSIMKHNAFIILVAWVPSTKMWSLPFVVPKSKPTWKGIWRMSIFVHELNTHLPSMTGIASENTWVFLSTLLCIGYRGKFHAFNRSSTGMGPIRTDPMYLVLYGKIGNEILAWNCKRRRYILPDFSPRRLSSGSLVYCIVLPKGELYI